ncbi:NACHT domain-containing protein [Streptomyces sp. NPDC059008]|uniref:NACHT domain-containing protein n=1 Tax=Streptomyces sp. NPDC059008 TaxID=3346693 RepID=UPI003681D3DA
MAARRTRVAAAIALACASASSGVATELVPDQLPDWLVKNSALSWAAFSITALLCLGVAAWQAWMEPQEDLAPDAPVQQQHRRLMLQRQRDFWVDGVLHQSLEVVTRLELGLETRSDAVERPWNVVVYDDPDRPRALPAGTCAIDVFDRSGGSLLVLGMPGSGKTTLLLEIAAELLERAQCDGEAPMPVVFNLSSWGKAESPLEQWLEDELHRRYTVPRPLARQWLHDEMILPLLDGLDEVRVDRREGCVRAINAFLGANGPLQIVVCSRVADYEDIGSRLRLNRAVFIRDLTQGQVLAHLAGAGAQLAGLHTAIAHDDQLLSLLASPLLLNVASLVYRGLSAQELEAEGRVADRRSHLIDSYIRHTLRRRPSRRAYDDERVVRWLGELAHQMSRDDQTVFHVEWMQPGWVSNPLLRVVTACLSPLVLGVAMALASGYAIDHANTLGARLFGLGNDVHVAGVSTGWLTGAAIGALVCVFAFDRAIRPAEIISWSLHSLRHNAGRQLRSALPWGVALSAIVGTIMHVWGLATTVVFAAFFMALPITFYVVVGGVSPQLREARISPNEGMRRSLVNAVAVGLPGGTAIGILAGVAFGARMTLLFGVIDGLTCGTSVFVLTALHTGGRAWLHHYTLRVMLALQGRIPLRWVRFLQDASDRILLRRVGGGYMFVHGLFLDHFAALHARGMDGSAPAGPSAR